MQLETRRLLLREFAIGDWQSIHVYRCDPRFLASHHRKRIPKTETRRQVQAWIERQSDTPRQHYQFVMQLKLDDRIIGTCGVHLDEESPGLGQLDLELDSDLWNQGYTTEALQKLLGFCFSELNLEHVLACCLAANNRMARVLEKCGLRLERREPDQINIGKQKHDALFYAMTARDWQKIRFKRTGKSRFTSKEHD